MLIYYLLEVKIFFLTWNMSLELQVRSRKAEVKNKIQKLKFKNVSLDSKVQVTSNDRQVYNHKLQVLIQKLLLKIQPS